MSSKDRLENREELEKALHDVWVKCEVNQDVFSDLTDFILDNFDPKQSETLTAKEFFLVYETDLYGDKLFRAAFSSREKAISYIKESDQRRHFDIDTHDLNPESDE